MVRGCFRNPSSLAADCSLHGFVVCSKQSLEVFGDTLSHQRLRRADVASTAFWDPSMANKMCMDRAQKTNEEDR